MLGPFLDSQQEIDLGCSGGHVGLDEEGLEPDEIGDHVQDQWGSI